MAETTGKIVLIVGRKGCGKSTWLRARLRQLDALLIWDPNDEHGDLDPDPPVELELIERVVQPSETLQQAYRYLGWKTEALPPSPEFIEEAGPQIVRCTSDFDFFLDLVELADGYVIAIDEAHSYWKTHATRLDRLIQTVRHREQDWYLISHRISWVPYSITTQMDKVVCFQMTWRPDLEMMEKNVGVDPEKLKALGVGQCIEVNG